MAAVTGAARQFARFGRFSLIGALGAALQLALFELLVRCLRLPGVAAAPVAVELVVLNNFFWHERFTWRDRWRDRRAAAVPQRAIRLWRFHAANGLVSLAGNTALAWLLMEKLQAPALLSAAGAIAVCAPINFLLADRWVYEGSPATQPRRFGVIKKVGRFCCRPTSFRRKP